MQKTGSYIWLICSVVSFLTACVPGNKQAVRINRPVLYNPASSSLYPEIGIFHVSDVESQLYIVINTGELLVSEANVDRIPQSGVRIHYQLFDCTETENNKIVSDSATFVNYVEIKRQQKILVFPILFPAEQGRRYMLLVQTTDLLRQNTIRQFLTVNKTGYYSAQNFKVTAMNGTPKPDNTVNENEIVRIIYQRKPVDSLYIKYFSTPSAVAGSPLIPLPAREVKLKPDSTWVQVYSPGTNFIFAYEGIYLVQTDTVQQDGLLLMNFGTSYPNENRTAKLVQPIQYFTTNSEYQNLSQETNPKKMMDNFWLAATGSTDKARMLIRVFYTRMNYANRYFTDYREGWKTDRGMIYMIYGLPNNIMKGSVSETWEYTRKQRAEPVSFTFDNVSLPYSDNYYVLRRDGIQSTYWQQAVNSWRTGKVFTFQDLE